MKKIVIAILSLIVLITLSSCIKVTFRPVTCGDFVYTRISVTNPEDNVAIIGLSEEGSKKETIVFPTELDGDHVQQIGAYTTNRGIYN